MARKLIVVYCDGSVSLLNTEKLEIVGLQTPSKGLKYEFSQVVTKANSEDVTLFILVKAEVMIYFLPTHFGNYIFALTPYNFSIIATNLTEPV